MKLLILGGTKFLGRHLVEAAMVRNHQVTLFNRGQTNPGLFPSVEKLRGNRDGELAVLKGRNWDAVIDTCGFASAKVRATASLLADSVGHYTFISSISVYRDFTKPGLDESAPVEQLPQGVGEDEASAETYGARKALCEQAAEAAMPGKVMSVRAGLLIGPHDASGRFLYWVRRTAQGGELLAPGHPDAPVQFIDARDLAQWIIRSAESGRVGIYNATGPVPALTFGQMLEQCSAATGGEVRMTWVAEQFLLEQRVTPFRDLPLWLPSQTDGGFFAVDCRRAMAAGLACRPLSETLKDILIWDRTAGSPLGKPLGLQPNRELELLKAWESTRGR
jgi:2'-hydroxyisoflavone reductase